MTLTAAITDLVAEARSLADKGACPQHPAYDALGCQGCAADWKADGDWVAVRHNAALRAMATCDRLFPARFRDALPDNPDVAAWVGAVIDNPADAPSLLLLGPVGTGKTHQSYGALRGVVAHLPGFNWAATTFADFTAALRPRHGVDSESEMDRHKNAGLLLLDDIGAAKGSEWVEEVTYRLVNSRYEAMSPTIYATNFGTTQLREVAGDRIASRLAETCQRVILTGPDRRRPAA